MKLFISGCCRYSFRYPQKPRFCPGLGRKAVRTAAETGPADFNREQEIPAEKILSGIYAATG